MLALKIPCIMVVIGRESTLKTYTKINCFFSQMGSIGSAQEVLRRAVYMCGVQIARDPQLRATLRDALRERATVTVKPTPRGLKEIDENHNCYG